MSPPTVDTNISTFFPLCDLKSHKVTLQSIKESDRGEQCFSTNGQRYDGKIKYKGITFHNSVNGLNLKKKTIYKCQVG